MAEEYSKYTLYRKYITEDGVNYTPSDEYQALVNGLTNQCDCGYREYEYRNSDEIIYGFDKQENWKQLSNYIKKNKDGFLYVRIDTNNYIPNIQDDYVYFSLSGYLENKPRRFGVSISKGIIYDDGYEINIKDQKEIAYGVYEYRFNYALDFHCYNSNDINYLNRSNNALNYIFIGDNYDLSNNYMKQYEYEYCPSNDMYDKKTGREKFIIYGVNDDYCSDDATYIKVPNETVLCTDSEVKNGVYVTSYSGWSQYMSSSSSIHYKGDYISIINTDPSDYYNGYMQLTFKTKSNKIVFNLIEGSSTPDKYSTRHFISVDGVEIFPYGCKSYVVYLDGNEDTEHKIQWSIIGSSGFGVWSFNAVREGYTYYPTKIECNKCYKITEICEYYLESN